MSRRRPASWRGARALSSVTAFSATFWAGPFDRWLASLELLARLFPRAGRFAAGAVAWLWAQRDARGFWGLGPRPPSSSYFPLSDSWRRRENRVFDWTTRVLTLLAKLLPS